MKNNIIGASMKRAFGLLVDISSFTRQGMSLNTGVALDRQEMVFLLASFFVFLHRAGVSTEAIRAAFAGADQDGVEHDLSLSPHLFPWGDGDATMTLAEFLAEVFPSGKFSGGEGVEYSFSEVVYRRTLESTFSRFARVSHAPSVDVAWVTVFGVASVQAGSTTAKLHADGLSYAACIPQEAVLLDDKSFESVRLLREEGGAVLVTERITAQGFKAEVDVVELHFRLRDGHLEVASTYPNGSRTYRRAGVSTIGYLSTVCSDSVLAEFEEVFGFRPEHP